MSPKRMASATGMLKMPEAKNRPTTESSRPDRMSMDRTSHFFGLSEFLAVNRGIVT